MKAFPQYRPSVRQRSISRVRRFPSKRMNTRSDWRIHTFSIPVPPHLRRCHYVARNSQNWAVIDPITAQFKSFVPYLHRINHFRLDNCLHAMMTSSNGNIFRVIGHLCGEFTGPRGIPHIKASDEELLCLLLICVRINGWVNKAVIVRQWGESELNSAKHGQKKARNEMVHQILVQSNQRFVCKCAETAWTIRLGGSGNSAGAWPILSARLIEYHDECIHQVLDQLHERSVQKFVETTKMQRSNPVNTTSWCPRRLGMDKVLWTSLCRLRMNGHGNDFMETCAMRDDNHKPALTTKRRRGNFQPIRLIESKESHQVSMTFCLRFEIVWTLRFLKIVCSNVILTLPKRH